MSRWSFEVSLTGNQEIYFKLGIVVKVCEVIWAKGILGEGSTMYKGEWQKFSVDGV